MPFQLRPDEQPRRPSRHLTRMVLSILVPLLIAVVGVLILALSANPKLQRVGEFLAFSGIFVVTWVLGSEHIKF